MVSLLLFRKRCSFFGQNTGPEYWNQNINLSQNIWFGWPEYSFYMTTIFILHYHNIRFTWPQYSFYITTILMFYLTTLNKSIFLVCHNIHFTLPQYSFYITTILVLYYHNIRFTLPQYSFYTTRILISHNIIFPEYCTFGYIFFGLVIR